MLTQLKIQWRQVILHFVRSDSYIQFSMHLQLSLYNCLEKVIQYMSLGVTKFTFSHMRWMKTQSPCTFAKFRFCFCCPCEETMHSWHFKMRHVKILIRLRERQADQNLHRTLMSEGILLTLRLTCTLMGICLDFIEPEKEKRLAHTSTSQFC